MTANVSEGTLSYQWYSNTSKSNTNGTVIQGAVSSFYNAPNDKLGTLYYYCVVTNNDSTATGNISASAVSNAVSVTIYENSEVYYTVTFDSQKGSKVASITVKKDSTTTEPTKPTRKGYVFGGWYDSTKYVNRWNFKNSVTGDMTLYAKWTLATPNSIKARVLSRKRIRLTWKKVSAATGYKVYRAKKKNGKYKLIRTVKKTKFINIKSTKNQMYYYKIRAYRKDDTSIEYSNYIKVVSKKVK